MLVVLAGFVFVVLAAGWLVAGVMVLGLAGVVALDAWWARRPGTLRFSVWQRFVFRLCGVRASFDKRAEVPTLRLVVKSKRMQDTLAQRVREKAWREGHPFEESEEVVPRLGRAVRLDVVGKYGPRRFEVVVLS